MVSSDLRGNQVTHAGVDDPGVDPVELANERAQQLLGNISSHALQQLAEARDHLDDLMRGIRARQQTIESNIAELAQFAADAVAAKVVISDGIQQLTARLKPRPAPTITQG